MNHPISIARFGLGSPVAAALLLALAPSIAAAQGSSCHIPDRLDLSGARSPAGEKPHVVPIRGFVLALSWSPQFCRSHADDSQCDSATGRFGFIVHGLWPQGMGRDHPEWCPAVPLPESVVRAQFCATPSPRLIAHEWARHGACASRNPADYFQASRTLFAAIRFPDMTALSRRPIDVGGFKRLIAAGNRAIAPSHLIVLTDRQGDWLREVYVCLARNLRPEPCPRGGGSGAPDGTPLRIWRDAR
jgi:ribonuclease T2